MEASMARVVLIMLVVLVAVDHYMSYGKYTSAAMRASSQILHHLRVI
jgi:hypothetical protein